MAGSYIIVGTTGTGKTTFLKNRIANVKESALFLYDVNNEYGKGEKLSKFEDFLKQATKLRESVICFEEATIFFGNKSDSREMVELLVRKRHTNNTIFLVFHSLRSVPKNIAELVNGIFLFHTNDSVNGIDTKFKNKDITDAYNRIKEKRTEKNPYIFEYILIN